MSKGFWIIIGAIVVIFGGFLLFKGDEAEAPTNGAAVSNHVIGSDAKGVKLVEYGDFQCPACASYFPLVEEIVSQYQDQIQFQFRHLPLTQNHKNAFAASRAAEAADKQGKFWEMYRTLYQNQQSWAGSSSPLSIFEQYAQQLGLNVGQFKTDFASGAVNDTINADVAEFKKTGEAMGTPTFFLNGTRIKPASLDEFKKLIDDELAKQQKQQ